MTSSPIKERQNHCFSCGFDLSYSVDTETFDDAGNSTGTERREYSHLLGIEISAIYDGILYWQCPNCNHRTNRWPEGHFLHDRAEHWIAQANLREKLDAPLHEENTPSVVDSVGAI